MALAIAGGVILLVAYVYFAGWYLPPLIVQNPALDTEAKLKAVGDVRTAFLGVLVPVAAFIAGWVAYLNYRETVAVTRRGQVTDRFTKAIDQLGKLEAENLHFRVGGIYALEQISRDSDELHWPVMEVLTAFLRERSAEIQGLPHLAASLRERLAAIQGLPQLAADLQAAATVVGRRGDKRREQERKNIQLLDLSAVMLPRARLGGAHLEGADLGGAHLERANLVGAHLERASLVGAHLERASLGGADLEGANLIGAHLEEANLGGADLEGASLISAHLEEANLTNAVGLTREQLGQAFGNKKTRLPADLQDVTLLVDPDV